MQSQNQFILIQHLCFINPSKGGGSCPAKEKQTSYCVCETDKGESYEFLYMDGIHLISHSASIISLKLLHDKPFTPYPARKIILKVFSIIFYSGCSLSANDSVVTSEFSPELLSAVSHPGSALGGAIEWQITNLDQFSLSLS